jgi:hypothetical protein
MPDLRDFTYKTLVVIGAVTLCVGISYAATIIGTNITTDGTLNVGGIFGIATSSPGSLFSVGGITNFTTATSTFYSSGGLNLAGCCFAVNGTCVSRVRLRLRSLPPASRDLLTSEIAATPATRLMLRRARQRKSEAQTDKAAASARQ